MQLRIIPLLLMFLALIGCSTLEYKSDKVAKVPLEPVEQVMVKVEQVWSARIGSGAAANSGALEVVRIKDVIYGIDASGEMAAVNAQDGKIIWKKNIKHKILAGLSAAPQNNLLFAISSDGELLALNPNDGTIVWQTSLNSEGVAVPAADNKKVFVHTLDGAVTAFSQEDGRQLWRYTTINPNIMLRQAGTPAIAGDYILVGFASGKLVALQRSTGSVVWEQTIAIPKGRAESERMVDVSVTPVVLGNMVYTVSYQGQIRALKLSDGNTVWQRPMSSHNGLTVNEQHVIVAGSDGTIWNLRRDDGSVDWKQSGLLGRSLNKPMISDNMLVVADDEGYIHWLSLKTGSFIGRAFPSKSAIDAPFLMYNSYLLSYSQNGTLRAYQQHMLNSNNY